MPETICTDHDIIWSEYPNARQIRLTGDLINIFRPDESMSGRIFIDVAGIAGRFCRICFAGIAACVAFMRRIIGGSSNMLLAGSKHTSCKHSNDKDDWCDFHILFN